MSKIKFDYEAMRKNVLPQLEEIKNDLQSACEIFNSMSIPNFDKKDYLVQSKTDVLNIKNSVEHIGDWIESSNRSLDNLIDNYLLRSKTMPNYTLKIRDSVIK